MRFAAEWENNGYWETSPSRAPQATKFGMSFSLEASTGTVAAIFYKQNEKIAGERPSDLYNIRILLHHGILWNFGWQ